jgi:O-antigen/teichoic acid export membrane protein
VDAEPPVIPAHEVIADRANIGQHRSKRERLAWLTGKVGLLSRAISFGARLIIIPLSIKLLGAERYGLWLTIGSMIGWMNLGDLGMTPGIVNSVAAASGKDDTLAMRRHISTGFFAFVAIGALPLILAVPVSQWSGFQTLLGISGRPELWHDARVLVVICAFYFGLTVPLRLTSTVAAALQQGYLAGYSLIFSNLLNLLLLGAVAFTGVSLPVFALLMSAPTLVASALLGLYLFYRRYPQLAPTPRHCDLASLKTIFGYGGPLMLVQLAELAVFYSTNLLIATRLGPTAVSKYAVPYAGFMAVSGIVYTLVSPYLPAYAEASERGDWAWIRKTAYKTVGIAAGLTLAADVGILVLGKAVIRLWAGPEVVPEWHFLLAMSVFFLALNWTSTTGVLLIGLGRVKLKAALHVVVAASYLVSCWVFLPRFGLIAVPVAGTLAFLFDVVLSLPLGCRYIRRRVRAGNSVKVSPFLCRDA